MTTRMQLRFSIMGEICVAQEPQPDHRDEQSQCFALSNSLAHENKNNTAADEGLQINSKHLAKKPLHGKMPLVKLIGICTCENTST